MWSIFESAVTSYRWVFLRVSGVLGFGWGIVALSFLTAVITHPLMKLAVRLVRQETEYQEVLLPQILDINMRYETDMERNFHIRRLYARYSYTPLSAIKKILPLFVQLPLLILTYYMLRYTPELSGQKFGFLMDLSLPDSLIPGKYIPFLFVVGRGTSHELQHSINLLPFVMTAVNIITVFATPAFLRKERIQAICLALGFLVLLYGAPSALLLYWTINNIISLVKTVVSDKYLGGRLLLRRIVALKGVKGFLVNKIDEKHICWGILCCTWLSIYCYIVVHSFTELNDACHGLTYTLSIGFMFVAAAIAACLVLVLAHRRNCCIVLDWVLLFPVISFVVVLIALFLFSRDVFWVFVSRYNLNSIYYALLLLDFVAMIATLRKESNWHGRGLRNLCHLDYAMLTLPIIFAIHYAYSSAGFRLPIVSVVALALYMLMPCVVVGLLSVHVFGGALCARSVFKATTGGIAGVYVLPMISSASGILAFDQNFFIRIGLIILSGFIFLRFVNGRFLKLFCMMLLVLVVCRSLLLKVADHHNVATGSHHYNGDNFSSLSCVKTNSIYFLIYDGYAQRIVREGLGLDIGEPIENYLVRYGFSIYDAYSIGSGTIESMSAAFTIGGIGGGSRRSAMAGDNPFCDFLKNSGYRTSYLTNGYCMPNFGERMPGDFYYPKASFVKRPEFVLLPCICRGYLSQSSQTFNAYTHEEWVEVKNSEIVEHMSSRRFIYAHSSRPDHCASYFIGRKSDAEEQLLYSKRLLEANEEIMHDVQTITEKDEDAIVIITSDHGGALISPNEPGVVDPRHLLDRHGMLLAIKWPKDYVPTINLYCLQNVLLEVMIYLSGDKSLAQYAIDGTTNPIHSPWNTPRGSIRQGVVQIGESKGMPIFEAARKKFRETSNE